jgi:hypothetical protein
MHDATDMVAPGRWAHLPRTSEVIVVEVLPYYRRPHALAPRHHGVAPKLRRIRGGRKKTTRATSMVGPALEQAAAIAAAKLSNWKRR